MAPHNFQGKTGNRLLHFGLRSVPDIISLLEIVDAVGHKMLIPPAWSAKYTHFKTWLRDRSVGKRAESDLMKTSAVRTLHRVTIAKKSVYISLKLLNIHNSLIFD